MAENKLTWQSKLVLLAVLPFAGTEVVLDCNWWVSHAAPVALWTIGLSALLGLVTWKLRAATPAAALTGALITLQTKIAKLLLRGGPIATTTNTLL